MAGADYKVFEYDLSVVPPGGFVNIKGVPGLLAFVDALDGSGGFSGDAKVEVALGEDDDDWIPLRVTNQLRNLGGYELRIRWDAQAGVKAKFLTGNAQKIEPVLNARADAVQILGVAKTEAVPGAVYSVSTNAVIATGAGVAVLAASTVRQKAIIANLGAGTVFITDSAVTGRGIPLAAGEVRELETSAAIFVRNDSGASVAIGLAEIKRVA
ncbi:MAG: hypothetical protein JKY94_01935 [Rhodobacteraceae bacterium]|nr:hypothetical protein [Paracoccaceae bacterium]